MELDGTPAVIAIADYDSAPAEVSFVRSDLTHLDIHTGQDLDLIDSSVEAHGYRTGQKFTRKTEGVIGPVYA
jgi:hypothetical protein